MREEEKGKEDQGRTEAQRMYGRKGHAIQERLAGVREVRPPRLERRWVGAVCTYACYVGAIAFHPGLLLDLALSLFAAYER